VLDLPMREGRCRISMKSQSADLIAQAADALSECAVRLPSYRGPNMQHLETDIEEYRGATGDLPEPANRAGRCGCPILVATILMNADIRSIA